MNLSLIDNLREAFSAYVEYPTLGREAIVKDHIAALACAPSQDRVTDEIRALSKKWRDQTATWGETVNRTANREVAEYYRGAAAKAEECAAQLEAALSVAPKEPKPKCKKCFDDGMIWTPTGNVRCDHAEPERRPSREKLP